MAGAICLNSSCNWSTHDVNNIKVINNEINNSAIGKKFKELEIQDYSYENEYIEYYHDLFEGL